MRIALWNNLPSGGGKRALYDQVTGLLSRGHDIESWCPPTADRTFLPLEELVDEHVVALDPVGDSRIARAQNLVTKDASSVRARLRAFDNHARQCAREINSQGFDVVLVSGSSFIAVSPIGRHLDPPSALYLQEPSRHLFEALPRPPFAAAARRAPGLVAALKWLRDGERTAALRVQVREETESARSFDRVLVNSYFSRESVLRAYGVDARVCYLGVDTDRFIDRVDPREYLAVGIGAFVAPKRVEVALEAIASLPRPRPALAWIGNAADDDYLAGLHARARTLDVDFRPLRAIADAEVVKVLNAASVMIYAPRLEPFGYAPLEAAACGLPVVAKAEGGVRETVIDGRTGLLVDDDAELGPAIGRVLGDPQFARRLGDAARANVVGSWSLDAATTRLESHLTDLAARAR